ncbi:hypothetical protein SCLCIDRAFT_66772, partial [Scleroderma citrinum Foug A]
RLTKEWTSPVYAFYLPTPSIKYVTERRCHVFKCLAKGCKHAVCRFLDTRDRGSTGNMRRHVRTCWGEGVYNTILNADTLEEACAGVKGHVRNGSIALVFGRNKKGYSHQPHTKFETKAEIVCWVSESLCLFDIITDRGFQSLMKMGRPGYYLPHPTTVSRDVLSTYQHAKAYDGELNFATDAWTSPNH